MGSELIPVLKTDLPMSLPNQPQPSIDQASAKLYDETRNSVVKITTDSGKTASGFVVNDGTEIVSSARSLLGSKEQFALGTDGKRYRLELEKMDDLKDLAVLKIEDGKIAGASPLPLGDIESLNPDDRVWALSFPQAAESNKPYLSPGYVRGLSTPFHLLESIDISMMKPLHDKVNQLSPAAQSDAAQFLTKPAVESKLHLEMGSGGGPILQKDGKVIAVASMTNGMNPAFGQSLAAPVEDLKGLLAGKGRFQFSYRNESASWAEQYKADWQNDRAKAIADTAVSGAFAGLAYRAATRFPTVAAVGLGGFGLLKLSSDVNHLLESSDSADNWKYGLSAASDLGTVGGAMLTAVPRLRAYGLALAAIGLAGRAASDFICNRTVLEQTSRIDGQPGRPPFSLDNLLKFEQKAPEQKPADQKTARQKTPEPKAL